MSGDKPQVTASRVAYETRWIRIREDRVLHADGREGLYSVVEQPDFVVVMALDATGNLCLVEQYRYAIARRSREFPRGAWLEGVHAPVDVARGELREETGIIAGQMRHVGRLALAGGQIRPHMDIFLATDLTQAAQALEAEEQGLTVHRHPVAEVQAMILSGAITDTSTVAAFGLARLRGWI
jgi:ADP-ribose pyrophosphatase